MMREYRRGKIQRSRLNLRRRADGSLRAATDESDIADIWAEQRRIKLAQAIQEDQRKAAAKQQGWKRFFKKRQSLASHADAKQSPSPSKEVVVTLSLPKLKRPKMPSALSRALADVPKKRLYIGGALLSFFLILTFVGPFFYGKKDANTPGKKAAVTSTVLDAKSQKPAYETIFPEGETVEDLGGWRRVSPPGKEPVFAYADTLTGTPITVSQQPLPSNFRENTSTEMEKLAGQFGANEKATAGDITIYIGTSIKGPQSVLVAKRNLLILIKSDAKIDNQAWIEYIETLR